MLTLTRYLYSKDEVQFSLICSILEKLDFKESLFWFSELYYSDYKDSTWNLLWEVYYNFYARKNPKLEKIFIKLYKKWEEENDIQLCLHVLKSLFFNTQKDSFCYRYFKKIDHQKTRTKSYRGRPPGIIQKLKIDKKYKNFIISIQKKHFTNMIYYMNRFKKEQSQLYAALIEYFKYDKSISLKQDHYQSILNHPYKNKMHILLSLIFYLMTDEKEINKQSIYLLISKDELEYVQKTNEQSKRLYHTLKDKRLYKIRTNIGCFPLERYEPTCPAMNKVLWDHWKYYSYMCPLWKKRFDIYDIELDHINKKIIFKKEEEEEEFSEMYNYEPDEQSLSTQEKSIDTIEKIETDCYINVFLKDG